MPRAPDPWSIILTRKSINLTQETLRITINSYGKIVGLIIMVKLYNNEERL